MYEVRERVPMQFAQTHLRLALGRSPGLFSHGGKEAQRQSRWGKISVFSVPPLKYVSLLNPPERITRRDELNRHLRNELLEPLTAVGHARLL